MAMPNSVRAQSVDFMSLASQGTAFCVLPVLPACAAVKFVIFFLSVQELMRPDKSSFLGQTVLTAALSRNTMTPDGTVD